MLAAILGWLRKGYPQGVPPKDYIPLVALLHRRLTEEELEQILGLLQETDSLPVGRSDITAAIGQVAQQPPSDEDVAAVAGRLAAAGWPLERSGVDAPSSPPRRALLSSVVSWLRAGYPTGVPEQDHFPLLALMRRRLTDEEIGWIVADLDRNPDLPLLTADIGVLITKITNEMPDPSDVARVRERLAAVGWDIDGGVGPSDQQP